MNTVNEKWQHAAISHAVDMAQYSTHVVQRVIAVLNRSDAELAARLAAALQDVDATTFTVERLEQLLTSVRQLNTQAYRSVEVELGKDLQEAAAYEAEYQADLFASTLPEVVISRVGVASVSGEQVAAAAMSRPFQGRLLSGWAKKLESDRMARIREAVRQGGIQGESVEQVVRRIRGTRALRYGDGIVARSRHELVAVAGTAIGHAASVARETFFQANSHLIASEQWLATLDSKTSEPCRIRDGKRYTLERHQPIGHKVPWLHGPGRLHFRCRSCAVPQTRTFRELGIPIDEVPIGERASMDGPVTAELTYADWFKQLSPHRQDEIVGPTRGKLMREEALPFDAIYAERGLALTLGTLKTRRDRDRVATADQ